MACENIGWDELGKKFQANGPNLRKILLDSAGDKWHLEFKSKKFGIDEKVTMNIPPLLSPQMIQKLKEKSRGRMLWERGTILHEYLFSRMIFDGETGKALVGQFKSNRYYRLVWPKAKNKYAINADDVEERVVEEIFRIIQDDEAFKTAILQANSKKGMITELKEKKIFFEKEIKKSLAKNNKFQDAIGDYEGDDIKVFFASIHGKIRENEERIKESQERIKSLDEQIAKIPDDEEIKKTHEQIKKYSENILGKKEQLKKRAKEHYEFFVYSGSAFSLLPFQEKRKFMQLILGGFDEEGKRNGVYIWPGTIRRTRRPFRFEIRNQGKTWEDGRGT